MSDYDLDLIGAQCDWGDCNDESVALRWAADLNLWLPVCEAHRRKPDE